MFWNKRVPEGQESEEKMISGDIIFILWILIFGGVILMIANIIEHEPKRGKRK
jgi:hypothetical protein